MSYKKKQKHTYINIMSKILNTKDPLIIKNNLKEANFKVKEKDINIYLDKELEVESRRISYSCGMNEIFDNDFKF